MAIEGSQKSGAVQAYLDNFTKLFNAASTGTDNSLSILYSGMVDSKVAELSKSAKTKKMGAELTPEELIQTNQTARTWVKTKGLEQLKGEMTPAAEEGGGLAKIEKFIDVFQGFNNGPIAGIMSVFKNFKEYVTSFFEAKSSNEDPALIRSRKEAETAAEKFAKDYKLNVTQFKAEVKAPPTEAVVMAKVPTEAELAAAAQAEEVRLRIEREKAAGKPAAGSGQQSNGPGGQRQGTPQAAVVVDPRAGARGSRN